MPTDDLAMRRRAAAVAGHLGDAATARTLLADPAGSVGAAALGALDRCGALRALELQSALGDPDPTVRCRAAELAAHHPEVDLAAALGDADDRVVEVAAWAAGERAAPPAIVARLSEIATRHRDALCREAAVAALGALGAVEGLRPILAALDDKPAVRRRAVLALAPYEGPAVDAALRRAATDRDWQVRQAAEDLLSVHADPHADADDTGATDDGVPAGPAE